MPSGYAFAFSSKTWFSIFLVLYNSMSLTLLETLLLSLINGIIQFLPNFITNLNYLHLFQKTLSEKILMFEKILWKVGYFIKRSVNPESLAQG